MVYFDVHTIGELINEYYALHKGPDYVDELKAIKAWPKVVGTFIATHTIDLSIRNRVLFVRVDSDALRNELSYSKSLLVKNLNMEAGKDVLDDVVFG